MHGHRHEVAAIIPQAQVAALLADWRETRPAQALYYFPRVKRPDGHERAAVS